ncbi:Reverse transcriptase (RNA-dependent DNA polymerase) [Fragilaria crotonensis]|nr:Reverse transcriptase (RNA-dependent DNA polymerase) [Fragilaria crotonensis]
MWVKMFLKAQGYDLKENYLEQDNESAMKMEKNGRSSAGPRSRHIDIRYFWIKDRTESNGIQIRHCPTLQMLADFFTKPLQGALFTKFCDVLLGYEHVDSLALDPTSTLEERVGSTVEQAAGRGTDGTNDDEITDVLNKNSTGVTCWADEVKKGRCGRGRLAK